MESHFVQRKAMLFQKGQNSPKNISGKESKITTPSNIERLRWTYFPYVDHPYRSILSGQPMGPEGPFRGLIRGISEAKSMAMLLPLWDA